MQIELSIVITPIRKKLDTTPNDQAKLCREFRKANQLSEPDDIGIVISRIPQPLRGTWMNVLETAVEVMRSDSNAIEIYGEEMIL